MESQEGQPKMDSQAVPMSPSPAVPMSSDDQHLVRAAQSGDYGAFERLFERYRKMVFRLAYHMTQRTDDAEDITQEVFVRAFEHLHRYRSDAKFSTWLARIAINLCTDRARTLARRTALEQQEVGGLLSWMTTGRVVDPVEEVERIDLAALVRRVLRALPEHHRVVLILKDFEEKSYGEIAEILHCSISGAKLRVLRARRALRDRLAPVLRAYYPYDPMFQEKKDNSQEVEER
jgi:RNA polymerase sigma-70 factor (ECF subfamily)